MAGSAPSFWQLHPDTVPLLISLWNQGLSANQILVALGHPSGLTRSSVMGKAHRLGLRRAPIIQLKNKLLAKKEPRFHFKSVNPEPLPEGELTDLPEEDSSYTVSLFDAKPDQCRWPVGEMLYCGAPVVKGCNFSFCKHHHARGVVRSYRSVASGYNYKRW